MATSHQSSICFQWGFPNFLSTYEQARGFLDSGLIEAKFDTNYHWKLCIQSQVNADSGREFLSVHLYLVPKSRDNRDANMFRCRDKAASAQWVGARFEITIIDSGGNSYKSAGGPASEICIFEPNHGWGFNNFCPLEHLKMHSQALLPGGTLLLQCKAWIEEPMRNTMTTIGSGAWAKGSGEPTNLERLGTDFKNLLRSGINSDLTIFVQDPNSSKKTEYFVHKMILGARSPVFLAMFTSPVLENELNKIEINDFEDEIVYAMLEYMYTGTVNEKIITSQAADLLQIADKYLLDGLVEQCEIGISKHMDVNNAMEILVFADSHCRDWLKKAAIQFIARYKQQVLKTAAFQKVSKERPNIIVDLYLAC